jgi:hypothetical protein
MAKPLYQHLTYILPLLKRSGLRTCRNKINPHHTAKNNQKKKFKKNESIRHTVSFVPLGLLVATVQIGKYPLLPSFLPLLLFFVCLFNLHSFNAVSFSILLIYTLPFISLLYVLAPISHYFTL